MQIRVPKAPSYASPWLGLDVVASEMDDAVDTDQVKPVFPNVKDAFAEA